MRSLALAATGVAGIANAFLVVPETIHIEIESIPEESRSPNWFQTLDLECPGCPVKMPHSSSGEFTTEMKSHLELDFQVDLSSSSSESASGNRLLLNGFQIYPHADPFSANPLSAVHVVDDMPSDNNGGMMHGGGHHGGMMGSDSSSAVDNMMTSTDELGFTLFSQTSPAKDDTLLESVEIEFQVIQVADVFVEGIPSVHVSLLKDAEGTIMINDISTSDDSIVSQDNEGGSKCSSWLCSWIESLENHWNHWRPHCGMGGHRNETSSQPPHHRPHHGAGGHHGHHNDDDSTQADAYSNAHSSHHRQWKHLLRSIVSHVLVPILIGIVAGVLMSSIGMLVGTFIIFVWRMFARRHYQRLPATDGQDGFRPRCYFARFCPRARARMYAVVPAQEAQQQGVVDAKDGLSEHGEKHGLVDHMEPPPQYEEEDGEDQNARDDKV